MKNLTKKISAFLIFLFVCIAPLSAFSIEYESPTKYKYINDYVGIMDEKTRDEIISIGKELEDKTSAQSTIVIINSLQGNSIEDYANKLFRQWGIGTSEKDNGLLILMAIEDKQYRVEVGRGLEGAITDIYSNRVMEGEAKPYFKEGDYSTGLLNAYKVFAQDIATEYNQTLSYDYSPQENYKKSSQSDGESAILIGIIVFIILGDALFNKGRLMSLLFLSRRRGRYYGTGPIIRNNRKDDDDDDFFGPFGGGGGSSGGGFGGFGGGSSNGGGSSGSW